MVSLSTTRNTFKLPSHDHKRRDLLHVGKSEQETSKHYSAATRGKMEGLIIGRRPDPAESSSITTPSALTSYFQRLFQEQKVTKCGDVEIICDTAKARPDYHFQGSRKKKEERLERSLSLNSGEYRCSPTTPLVSKHISRWETGSPASTSGMRKTSSSGNSAESCAVGNANTMTSTMPRRSMRSNDVPRLSLDLLAGDSITAPRLMSASNEKKGELLIHGKEKMLPASFVQQTSNIAFEQPPRAPLEQPPHNAAA